MASPAPPVAMPVWPLLATLAVQTLATMSLYSLPTLAPEVARDLHLNGTLVGGFVATAYGVGIVSALLSPGLIRRYGGVRCQCRWHATKRFDQGYSGCADMRHVDV